MEQIPLPLVAAAAKKAATYIAYAESFTTPENELVESMEQTAEAYARVILSLSKKLSGHHGIDGPAGLMYRAAVELLSYSISEGEYGEESEDFEEQPELSGSAEEDE